MMNANRYVVKPLEANASNISLDLEMLREIIEQKGCVQMKFKSRWNKNMVKIKDCRDSLTLFHSQFQTILTNIFLLSQLQENDEETQSKQNLFSKFIKRLLNRGHLQTLNELITGTGKSQNIEHNKALFSMASQYVLQIASVQPEKETIDRYFNYLENILQGNPHGFVPFFPEFQHVFEECCLYIRSNEAIVILNQIENCQRTIYETPTSLKTTQEHINEILRELQDYNKIFFAVIDDNDLGQTTYDGFIFLTLTHRISIKGLQKRKLDPTQTIRELVETLCHEISHITRIRYASNSDIFKRTPSKHPINGEACEYFKDHFAFPWTKAQDQTPQSVIKRNNRKRKGCATSRYDRSKVMQFREEQFDKEGNLMVTRVFEQDVSKELKEFSDQQQILNQ